MKYLILAIFTFASCSLFAQKCNHKEVLVYKYEQEGDFLFKISKDSMASLIKNRSLSCLKNIKRFNVTAFINVDTFSSLMKIYDLHIYRSNSEGCDCAVDAVNSVLTDISKNHPHANIASVNVKRTNKEDLNRSVFRYLLAIRFNSEDKNFEINISPDEYVYYED